MAISPESGISRPTMHRSSVVFPQPLGPRRVKIRLAGMVRSTLSRAAIVLPSEVVVLVETLDADFHILNPCRVPEP